MQRRFLHWVFNEGLSAARSDSGEEVHFTQQERSLLARFVASPGLLLSRDRLLQALPRERADGSLRHVDYLISRLRRRLGDAARDPLFIATEYGEGYRWIAPALPAPRIDAFIVVMPLHRRMPPAAEAFMQGLCDALREQVRRAGANDTAALAPAGWQPESAGRVAYLVELSAWADAGTVHLALMLCDARTRVPVHPLRLALPLAGCARASAREDGAAVAGTLCRKIWAHRALAADTAAPTEPPPELRLHQATCLFGDPTSSWRDTLARLDGADAPDTPLSRDFTRAMVLATRIAQQSFRAECLSMHEWDALEAEIEQLVLPHLPAIAGQPLLELAAARLLSVTGGRHADTAFALARRGFAATTAFAAGFSTLAQCHVHAGEFEVAGDLYERSIELVEHNSEFHVLLLVRQCIAHLGSGDVDALSRCRDVLFEVKPATRMELGAMLYDADSELPAELAAMLPRAEPDLLARILLASERKARNYFRDPAHRANAMRGFVSHLARHAGAEVVPDSLKPLIVAPAS